MPFLLGRRALGPALAFALLTVSTAPAHAFCRTTTEVLPPNFDPAKTGRCFTEGLFLWWRNACVGYSVNASASASVSFADATRIIDGAFGSWSAQACPQTGAAPGIQLQNLGPSECADLTYNEDTPNQNLIVFRDDVWPYNDPNSTLGLTTVTFNALTGEIFDADLEINATRRNLSITDPPPANGFDLASVVTHEAGHFLGLAHAIDASATMAASYKEGTTALRSLAPDDVVGLCAIYPDAQTRVVTPTNNQTEVVPAGACDATPRFGFTTQCFVPKVETTSGCAATPGRVGMGSAAGIGMLSLSSLVFVRRGRRRR